MDLLITSISYKKLSMLGGVLLAVALACSLPAPEATEAPGQAETEAAQTLEAAAALTEAAGGGNTNTPAETPTQTLTPQPSFTPTSSITTMTVSVDTNCRSGPGGNYGLDGGLLVGEIATVVARDPSGNYWYIENPDNPGTYCWAWGEYATITGNTSGLPVYTPPPTPTPTFTPTPAPNFSVEFLQVENCVDWQFEFIMLNTGGVIWESVSLVVTDLDTATTTTLVKFDDFTERNACLDGASHYDRLNPGIQGYATSYGLIYDPAGHSMKATITLCSQDNLGGVCLTRNVNFVP
jgi:hypothetical protein